MSLQLDNLVTTKCRERNDFGSPRGHLALLDSAWCRKVWTRFRELAGILALATLSTHSIAQSQRLNPGLGVDPGVPQPHSAFVLRIDDFTDVFPTVLESSLTIAGSDIEVRSSIELGYANVNQGYSILQAISGLPAGLYSVKYFARTKRPDTALTEYFLEGSWNVLVVEPSAARPAIEYYNATFDHYFLTSDAAEVQALDAGQFVGWARTGEAIRVLAPGSLAGAMFPVCRFYGLPKAGLDTHFYSGTTAECATLSAQPEAWLLESNDVFRVALASLADGSCPVGLLPVYRLWNGIPTVNHRYTTSPAIQSAMVELGWIAEGSGPIPAVWCALP